MRRQLGQGRQVDGMDPETQKTKRSNAAAVDMHGRVIHIGDYVRDGRTDGSGSEGVVTALPRYEPVEGRQGVYFDAVWKIADGQVDSLRAKMVEVIAPPDES